MSKLLILLMICLVLIPIDYAKGNNINNRFPSTLHSVNPAYVGYHGVWGAQLDFRQKWLGVDGAPKRGNLFVDGLLDSKKNMGLGLELSTNKLGAESRSMSSLSYAYRLQMDSEDTKRLGLGVGLDLYEHSINGNLLNPHVAVDPGLPSGKQSVFNGDIRVGVYYSTLSYYFGISVSDVFAYKRGLFKGQRSKPNVKVMSGYLIDLNIDLKLLPTFILSNDFENYSSIELGTQLIIADRFKIGAAYHYNNLITMARRSLVSHYFSASVAAMINNQWQVGYLYESRMNNITGFNGVEHGIMIGFSLSNGKRKTTPKYF